jgi:hypothetical protein
LLKQAAIQETDEFTENHQQTCGEEKDEKGGGGISQEPQVECNLTCHCDAVENMKGLQAFRLSRNSTVV